MRRLLQTLQSNPRSIFLVDGAGAILTATLLIAVVGRFDDHFGVPSSVTNGLALFALVLMCGSFTCFFWARRRWRLFLKIIAGGNLFYCGFTATLLLMCRDRITPLGVGYFSVEICVVVALAAFELKTASRG